MGTVHHISRSDWKNLWNSNFTTNSGSMFRLLYGYGRTSIFIFDDQNLTWQVYITINSNRHATSSLGLVLQEDLYFAANIGRTKLGIRKCHNGGEGGLHSGLTWFTTKYRQKNQQENKTNCESFPVHHFWQGSHPVWPHVLLPLSLISAAHGVFYVRVSPCVPYWARQ